jgi:hypothetical protein
MHGSKPEKYVMLLNTFQFHGHAFLVGINESTFTYMLHENYVIGVKNASVKHVFSA